jgi:methylthioribose-1-phosphate isomerase
MKVIEWLGDQVRIIDQTKLPHLESYLELDSYQGVAQAINQMNIRGAPAIGIATAYGLALGALRTTVANKSQFLEDFKRVTDTFAASRPTARNLFQVIERMGCVALADDNIDNTKKALVAEAICIHTEQEEADRKLSQLGAELIGENSGILTHCNTGPLATGGFGTAMGIIIHAYGQGKVAKVFATETRPICQGARLTAWELQQAKVPFRLITDSMAGYLLHRGEVNVVIVGADRIARNGDTANKIGTYSLAVLAWESSIPFYVAAPTTTIDPGIATGDNIPIEERPPEEVTHIGGVRVAPEGVEVWNPAFDITPAKYITAIITERGIISQPLGEGICEVI